MHVLADYVICFAILLLAFFLVGEIAGGTDTPNEKSTELLGYGAALLLYVPLRGATNYLYLRVGKFHKNRI
jgi:hypothetical protein